MVRRHAASVIAVLTLLFLFSPIFVLGQGLPSQIVPKSCLGIGGCQSICDIALLAQNVLNTGIFIAVFLSAILFAYAGWKALTAGGNASEYGAAKAVFSNVLIGLVIILAGWLVIDTLMRTLMGSNLGPWNSICEALISVFDRYYA